MDIIRIGLGTGLVREVLLAIGNHMVMGAIKFILVPTQRETLTAVSYTHLQRAAVLMEARAGQIQKEVKELERVRQVCLEVRDSGWRFDTLDPQLLEMKLEWEKKGKDIMKKDRIDRCV